MITPSRPEVWTHDEAAAASGLDLVMVSGFTGQTVIGIHGDELHATQPVVIDIHAGVPRPRACDTDSIDDTLDYSLLVERLRRLLEEHRCKLLEAFAETVARIVLDEFGARWVRVKVVKPAKFPDVAAVGVQIEREAGLRGTPAAVLRLIGGGMVPESR